MIRIICASLFSRLRSSQRSLDANHSPSFNGANFVHECRDGFRDRLACMRPREFPFSRRASSRSSTPGWAQINPTKDVACLQPPHTETRERARNVAEEEEERVLLLCACACLCVRASIDRLFCLSACRRRRRRVVKGDGQQGIYIIYLSESCWRKSSTAERSCRMRSLIFPFRSRLRAEGRSSAGARVRMSPMLQHLCETKFTRY